ncbi:MAG: hypothetical protein KDA89_24100 [Planctomycetaceae bacterium]|nr:hypothetical protein [Planctomycetaceae bacterium]
MKHIFQLAGLSAILAATPLLALDLLPIPAAPGTPYGPAPGDYGPVPGDYGPAPGEYIDAAPPYVESAPIPLFTRVKYVDRHEMHPCGITKIIPVKDPCAGRGVCCSKGCVYIEICVPPCGCEDVICRRHGDRVRYDYGKFAVDVRVKRGYIVVDYQR